MQMVSNVMGDDRVFNESAAVLFGRSSAAIGFGWYSDLCHHGVLEGFRKDGFGDERKAFVAVKSGQAVGFSRQRETGDGQLTGEGMLGGHGEGNQVGGGECVKCEQSEWIFVVGRSWFWKFGGSVSIHN